MILQVWTEILADSLANLWGAFIGFIPALIGAIIIFIIGLIVAAGLGSLIERVSSLLKLNTVLAKAGAEKYFKKAGIAMNIDRFFGQLTYWFILIAFFLAAADILKFDALSSFLNSVLLYIPQVIVAALIMLAAIILANFLRETVKVSVKGTGLNNSNFLGALTWWAVVIFALLASLSQLGIAVAIINTLVTGFVVMVALAGGIAFGFGGKGYAEHLIKKFREQVEDN